MNRDAAPSRRGFTLIELLVVIAIISLISSLAVPGYIEVRRRAQIANCANNLKQIYTFALVYSDKSGNGCFPFARERGARAHESFNELVAVARKALPPEVFNCPASTSIPALLDEDGFYTLAEENLSYTWVARRTKNTAERQPLACCKYMDGHRDEDGVHSGHKDGVNVLMTDGSVKFLPREDLDPETLLPPDLTR
ncbi:MAG TPA: prepilin-type N-terminal cleavage/methylation domain-containing protein [Planctomycetota bacterium]|nr:prepilin-type N-terminal cleavage/methylation domain-containing protein [Planctomycetota bacterium]